MTPIALYILSTLSVLYVFWWGLMSIKKLEGKLGAALAELRVAHKALDEVEEMEAQPVMNFVCDGPPSHESGRFVEVEDDEGRGMSVGEWVQHRTVEGWWSLRVALPRRLSEEEVACLEHCAEILDSPFRSAAAHTLRTIIQRYSK